MSISNSVVIQQSQVEKFRIEQFIDQLKKEDYRFLAIANKTNVLQEVTYMEMNLDSMARKIFVEHSSCLLNGIYI